MHMLLRQAVFSQIVTTAVSDVHIATAQVAERESVAYRRLIDTLKFVPVFAFIFLFVFYTFLTFLRSFAQIFRHDVYKSY